MSIRGLTLIDECSAARLAAVALDAIWLHPRICYSRWNQSDAVGQ
jgi:hypothetical protein